MSGNTKGEGGVMKTEAIRKCIKTEDIVNSIAAQGAVALAELKAIETALAAKDSEILNARREVTGAYVLSLQHILDGVIVLDTPKLVIRIEKTIRDLMEADLSLSPQTDKVLIDIEKLRAIEDGACICHDESAGETACCPVCLGEEQVGTWKIKHNDDCWIGNVLKDTQ